MKLLEQLNGLSKDLVLHVFTVLIGDYVKTLKNKQYTISDLKKKLEISHNSLYKAQKRFIDLEFFNVEVKESGYQLKLNLNNELVKDLVAIEYFRRNGLSFGDIMEKEGLKL
ncbi:MAG: hypothetical protein EAX96_12030 [Candidatus Lokiarchaeota archaeon]|nr:hypothetical protein [Candidatus Lokiarchaeota archaeon]